MSYRIMRVGKLMLVSVILLSGCQKGCTKNRSSYKAAGSSGNVSRSEPGKAEATREGKVTGKTGSSGSASSRANSNGAKPSPTDIKILNDLEKPFVFERTFGPQQPFGVTRLDGPIDPSVGLWDCWCRCGMDSCPEAARPRTSLMTLEPGKSSTFAWDGRLRRRDTHPKTGECCTLFNPPAGLYLFTACTQEGICSKTEVKLPTDAPILIKMSERSKATDCKSLNMKLAARGAKGFLRSLAGELKTRPVSSCPKTPVCILPGELQEKLKAAKKKACSLFVIPRGAEVELRAILPLPLNKVGGENYSSFSDPHFTRVFRVRYER